MRHPQTSDPKSRQPWRCGIVLLCITLSACSTRASFRKVEHFADYGGNGRANYYRVSIEGRGENGKVDYRSGWYDAKAVDELFGNVGQKHTIEAVTASRQGEAIEKTFDNYMKSLEGGDGAPDVDVARGKWRQSVNAVTGITSAGEGQVGAVDHADEKFVMILSNDPEKVIQAIKAHIQKADLGGSVSALLGADQAKKDATQHLRLSLLARQLQSCIEALQATETGLGTATPATRLQALGELASRLESVR